MSVQVKRRRDTATNVAAYTGAAGELIVDTTNNRVTVHDGATAGGFAAAKLSEVATTSRHAVADAAYTAQTSDRLIAYTSLTAARVVTLPAASAFPTGALLIVIDESGSCSNVNTITLTRAGSDTINGGASQSINVSYGKLTLESDGVSKWTSVDKTALPTLATLALGLNGATVQLGVIEQLVSGLSGASVTAGTPIPAGALVLAVGSRVVTAITGATSFEVGYGSGGTLSAFGSGLGLAAGSTNEGLIAPNPFYSGTPIILTAAGGGFTAGAVRLSIHYLTFSPPTS